MSDLEIKPGHFFERQIFKRTFDDLNENGLGFLEFGSEYHVKRCLHRESG